MRKLLTLLAITLMLSACSTPRYRYNHKSGYWHNPKDASDCYQTRRGFRPIKIY